jgi:hypothetical protein
MAGMGASIAAIVITLVVAFFSLAITGVVIWFVWTKVVGPIMKGQQQQARLLSTGYQAPARVLQVAQTGTYVNNQPQVSITLEVAPPGAHPYHAQLTTILSMLAIPRVQPGAMVTVRYDPTNPTQVAIEGL